MKDFDQNLVAASEADRTFRIRGVEFTFGPRVDAQVVADYEDVRFDAEKSSSDILKALDALITSSLNGGSEQWTELRQSADPPLSHQDMVDVMNHILEVTSVRPTEPSGGSSPSSRPPGTTSKASSSSQAETSKT